MSRFYDALKQANLSDQSTSDKSIEESVEKAVEEACGVLDIQSLSGIPKATNGNGRRKPDSSVDLLVANDLPGPVETSDPWIISPPQEAQGKVQGRDTPFKSLTKMAIDQSARVLPNAVDAAVVEHYRRLRTKIMQHHAAKPFRSLLITSASPQEGKTVTVMNLALSFAMLPSFKIAVVDGDLRRGSLGKWLGVASHPGLSNLIEGSATLENVVLKYDDSPIHFILSGTSQMPAAELLHSPQLSHQFRKMTDQFDLVLVDSPPVNLITDTQLLAANCDAVLLVTRAFSTTKKSLEKAVQDLAPFRVIGTVLNGGTKAHLYRKYNGYY